MSKNKDSKVHLIEEAAALRQRVAGLGPVDREGIKESELRYRSLFEHMINGFAYCQMIFENDIPVDFTYLEVNEAFEKLTGLKNVTGKRVSEVVPGIRESDRELFEIYGRVALTGKPECFETYVVALQMWFSIAVYSPARGYFVAVFDVITERKKAETELLRLNRLYDVLSQVNQAVVRVSDATEFLTHVCRVITERGQFELAWIGRVDPETRVIGPVAAAGIAKDYANRVNAMADDVPEGQGPTGRCVRDNKSYIINDYLNDPATSLWRQSSTPYGFGGVAAFPVLVNGATWGVLTVYSANVGHFGDKEVKVLEEAAGDIGFALSNIEKETQRKNTEEQVKRSAIEWRTTFDSIRDMVSIQDKNYRILRVNKSYAEALGIPIKEIIGKTCFEIVHGTDKPVPNCPHRITLETGKPASFEFNDAAKGTYSEVSTYPILNEQGEITSTVHVVHDITNRKLAEIENQKLRDNAEISSRLAAVGEMAAGIAHEINNPLTGVIGFSEVLLDRADLSAEVKEDLKIINDGSQQVKEIVKRLLTFARQRKPLKSSVSITELLDNTVELRSYVLRTSNIEVVKDYDSDLPWITLDSGQMQQVFMNIIINAEYAMKNAHLGGKLIIKAKKLDDTLQVSFQDDGTGIPQEVLAKLFQPFFTTKGPGEGTGLGLSLSRGIVMGHGGTIKAESAIGHGAKFTIDLPITPSSLKQEAEQVFVEVKQASNRGRVLVVDDELSVRAFVTTILSQRGHTVEGSDTPEDALEKLGRNDFDVVLLDIRMPSMSGMEMYNKLSILWPHLAKRVIFITGDAFDPNTRVYLGSHRIPYLVKPFDRATLENQVNTIMSS